MNCEMTVGGSFVLTQACYTTCYIFSGVRSVWYFLMNKLVRKLIIHIVKCGNNPKIRQSTDSIDMYCDLTEIRNIHVSLQNHVTSPLYWIESSVSTTRIAEKRQGNTKFFQVDMVNINWFDQLEEVTLIGRGRAPRACICCEKARFVMSNQLISPWAKWPPFRRRHFQTHFLYENFLHISFILLRKVSSTINQHWLR